MNIVFCSFFNFLICVRRVSFGMSVSLYIYISASFGAVCANSQRMFIWGMLILQALHSFPHLLVMLEFPWMRTFHFERPMHFSHSMQCTWQSAEMDTWCRHGLVLSSKECFRCGTFRKNYYNCPICRSLTLFLSLSLVHHLQMWWFSQTPILVVIWSVKHVLCTRFDCKPTNKNALSHSEGIGLISILRNVFNFFSSFFTEVDKKNEQESSLRSLSIAIVNLKTKHFECITAYAFVR